TGQNSFPSRSLQQGTKPYLYPLGTIPRCDGGAGRDGASLTRSYRRPRGDDTAARVGLVAARGRRVATHHVPDDDGDCLRCVLVGAS
ncbi:unnamed protein product, partial [Urochloa humidicola]